MCGDLDHEELKPLAHLPTQIETQTGKQSISRKLWVLNRGEMIEKEKKRKEKSTEVSESHSLMTRTVDFDCCAMINLDRSGLKNKTGAAASLK